MEQQLSLESDEGIILETTGIDRYGTMEVLVTDMILTNKNLIIEYEYYDKKRIFSKIEYRMEKISLSDIKIIDGKVQIAYINHDDYGDVMRLLYTNGERDFYSFGKKKELIKWINAINRQITGDETPLIEETAEKAGRLFFHRKRT